MTQELRETRLPGVGTKFSFTTDHGSRVAVIQHLDGSRELYAGGHLKDALRGLDRIDIGDPLRGEADRLRADIQRDVLAGAHTDSPVPPEATPHP